MKIPYGSANFADIRRDGSFYADKTPFLPMLESAEAGYKYLIFLRPRRFGKSTLLSMMEHYYDLGRADLFDELFEGLWIHEHPTPERNRYLVLPLDFSQVASDSAPEALHDAFLETVRGRARSFLIRYRDRVPVLASFQDTLERFRDAASLIANLLDLVAAAGQKAYVLIDEYDHFANRILADGGQDLYERLTRSGFVRSFYAALKAGTGSGAVGRLFITGVSPILLDDLSSGLNILNHITTHPRFNTLAGFTRGDMERAVDGFLASAHDLMKDPRLANREELLGVLEQFYNGYRFSEKATERVFNSDMALYFLKELENRGEYPARMLDMNVRVDYGRLQRIGQMVGGTGEERRRVLSSILSDGYIHSRLVEQFGARTIPSQAQFVSFLYYLGLLTFAEAPPVAGEPRLEIPNRVIRELSWEYLALLVREQEKLAINFDELNAAIARMALHGEIELFLALFQERVVRAMGVKDLRQFNEKALKLMLMTFLSLSRVFHPLSEKEFAQGYCDLFLAVAESIVDARFAWMLEIKYLPTGARAREVEKAIAQAEEQLARYTSDQALVALLTLGRELKVGTLVFRGAREAVFRPWPPQNESTTPTTRTRAKAAVPARKKGPARRGSTARRSSRR